MTNVLMHDSRRLVLPLETLVDVLIEFDQAHQRWPVNATLEAARPDESGGVAMILEGTLFLHRQHQELPVGYAATPQAARTGSSPEPSQAARVKQPDADSAARDAAASGQEAGFPTA